MGTTYLSFKQPIKRRGREIIDALALDGPGDKYYVLVKEEEQGKFCKAFFVIAPLVKMKKDSSAYIDRKCRRSGNPTKIFIYTESVAVTVPSNIIYSASHYYDHGEVVYIVVRKKGQARIVRMWKRDQLIIAAGKGEVKKVLLPSRLVK